MEPRIERHEDGTFTEFDADGHEIGWGDWRDERGTEDGGDGRN